MNVTEDDLAKAKEKALNLASDGTEKTNEERLAIARQERTIADLIDIEEKDEIQKLQLAVAKERLIELEEEVLEMQSKSTSQTALMIAELLKNPETRKMLTEELLQNNYVTK